MTGPSRTGSPDVTIKLEVIPPLAGAVNLPLPSEGRLDRFAPRMSGAEGLYRLATRGMLERAFHLVALTAYNAL